MYFEEYIVEYIMQNYHFDIFKICIYNRNRMEYREEKKKTTLIELILNLDSMAFLKLILASLTISLFLLEKYVYPFISKEMNNKTIFFFS